MKSLIVAMILATAVLAEPTSNFEVKEIEPSLVLSIDTANRNVDTFLKAFQEAQRALESSQATRDKVVAEAKQKAGGEFEGQCGWGSSSAGSYTLPSPKQFRRIEIRGKYALITSGSESCSSVMSTLTLGTPTSIWRDQ